MKIAILRIQKGLHSEVTNLKVHVSGLIRPLLADGCRQPCVCLPKNFDVRVVLHDVHNQCLQHEWIIVAPSASTLGQLLIFLKNLPFPRVHKKVLNWPHLQMAVRNEISHHARAEQNILLLGRTDPADQ